MVCWTVLTSRKHLQVRYR
uniref:Uncharacterized protein n=1 Tax=Anguilla anguilla TaxID=7936 RepID=A0A0E9Q0M6_ANGAN